MPQTFGNASTSNTQSELCLQQHCLAKHKNVQDFTVLHNSNQKCGMEQWMTVEISIKLKRKQPVLLLLPLKLHCFIKTTHYIKKHKQWPFSICSETSKPQKSPNLHHHPKLKYPRFHTVFNSLIRQRKSLPSLGTAAIYRTQNKVFPCMCVHRCVHICIHIFYSIVNMDVTKKKNQVCRIFFATSV